MYYQRFKTIEQCFWEKVRITPGCWEWIGCKNSKGRGNFRGRSAPRKAYELAFGPVLDNLYVCHHCDNPACVNPAHMFVGTQYDNVRDCIAKGRKRTRGRPGERHHNSKLSSGDVLNIRLLAQKGIPVEEIWQQYPVVGMSQIRRIIVGTRWQTSPSIGPSSTMTLSDETLS